MRKKLMKWTTLLFFGALLAVACDFGFDDKEITNKLDTLERRVSDMEATMSDYNRDIAAMQTIVQALDSSIYIKNVTTSATGYRILFSDGQIVEIRNGQDGLDGRDGQNGQDGKIPQVGDNGNWWIGTVDTGISAIGHDGQDGRDGRDGRNGQDGQDGQDGRNGQVPYVGENGNWWIGITDTGYTALVQANDVPVVSISEENGVYYWTLTVNGSTRFITDDHGNKIPVTGVNAERPIIRVNNAGYWQISYDGGIYYEDIVDYYGNPVKIDEGNGGSGCQCTSFFQSVSYSDGWLILVLVDGQVVKINTNGSGGSGRIDDRLDNVVPEDIQDKIKDHMPLYDGINPPFVEGAYLIEPMTCLYDEENYYQPGHEVIETVIRFSNQNTTTNTLDYEDYEGSLQTSTGSGAFISGSGDNFTAYFNTEGINYGDTYTKTALVISGTKTAEGIRNLYYAFVMVEKSGPNVDRIMGEGMFRIFKDEDGLSVNTTWSPPSSARAVDVIGLPATQWGLYSIGKK